MTARHARGFTLALLLTVGGAMSGAGAFASLPQASAAPAGAVPPACSVVTRVDLTTIFGVPFGDGQEIVPTVCRFNNPALTDESGTFYGPEVAVTVTDSKDPDEHPPPKGNAKKRAKYCKKHDGIPVKGVGSSACAYGLSSGHLEPGLTVYLNSYAPMEGATKVEWVVSVTLAECDANGSCGTITFTTAEAARDQLSEVGKRVFENLGV